MTRCCHIWKAPGGLQPPCAPLCLPGEPCGRCRALRWLTGPGVPQQPEKGIFCLEEQGGEFCVGAKGNPCHVKPELSNILSSIRGGKQSLYFNILYLSFKIAPMHRLKSLVFNLVLNGEPTAEECFSSLHVLCGGAHGPMVPELSPGFM